MLRTNDMSGNYSSSMKLRIKKSNALEAIMIEYLIILGLFSRWVELSRIWRLVLLLLFALLITKKTFAKELKKTVISFWFLIPLILFVLSGLFGDSQNYFFFNLNRIIWPLIIAVSLAIITITKPSVVSNVLDRNFYFLNIIWIVNLIVLAIQCSGTPLLIKKSWLAINSFYLDQCCGLFGNSGTHELSAFSVFIIMYDLYQAYHKKKPISRTVLLAYTFITSAIILVLSTQNDNMAFLFILPFFIFLFYHQKANWSGKNVITKFFKMLKYIVPIIVLLIITLQIPAINDFINNKVALRIERMLNYTSTGIAGSNVRVAAMVYSFTDGKGWLLGYGVGSWPFAEGTVKEIFLGFTNFGLNSMSTYLMLGGIWLYISSVFLFSYFLYIASYRKRRLCSHFVICVIVVVLFTFYTVLFNSLQSMLWLMMAFITFGFCKDNIEMQLRNRNTKYFV